MIAVTFSTYTNGRTPVIAGDQRFILSKRIAHSDTKSARRCDGIGNRN